MSERVVDGALIKSYVGRLKDEEILIRSSSGGAFTALSDFAFKSGFGIVCSTYDYEVNSLYFRFIQNETDRDNARGSKYLHSDPRSIFREIREWLVANPEKQIMYFGMGCEAAGLSRYLESVGLRNRCIIIDIICHGSCSPKIWNDYIEQKQKDYGQLSFVSFKDKRNGWHKPTAVGIFCEKEVFLDEYMKIFYSNKAMRPSCHSCRFSTKKRYTDITIGDAWGMKGIYGQSDDEKGYSLFLVHTKKGLLVFDQCKETLDFFEISEEECMQPNLVRPTPVSEYRYEFWYDYYEKGFKHILKKYGKHTSLLMLREKIKSKLNIKTELQHEKGNNKGTYQPIEVTQYFGNEQKDDKVGELPQLYNTRSDCCGCTACSSVCPIKAIVMKMDQEGYFYPTVNREKCIRCYKCIDVCPLK